MSPRTAIYRATLYQPFALRAVGYPTRILTRFRTLRPAVQDASPFAGPESARRANRAGNTAESSPRNGIESLTAWVDPVRQNGPELGYSREAEVCPELVRPSDPAERTAVLGGADETQGATPSGGSVRWSSSPETLAEAARVLREAVRDKAYRATPLGQPLGCYVRWCRNERGPRQRNHDPRLRIHARPHGADDPQPRSAPGHGRRPAHRDRPWAHREPNTRKKVTSAIRGFWKWAEDEGHVERSPAARLRSPKGSATVFRAVPEWPSTRG